MSKTIVILTHVMFDNSPYCSYVHNHAIALKNEGYNVIVFALLNWFPFSSIFRKKRKEYYKKFNGEKFIDGIKVVYKKRISFSRLLYNSKLNLNGIFYYLTIFRSFKKINSSNDVYLVDAQTFKNEGCAAYFLKKKFNKTTFLTCHGSSLDYNLNTLNGRAQIKKYCSKIDRIICVSDKQQRQLNLLGITNVFVIHNGINFYNNVIRQNNNHNIITVASLTSDKNIDKIILAFTKIHKKYNDATLTIIGNGPEKEKLDSIVKEQKTDDFVFFLGQLDNQSVYRHLSMCNIFALLSSPEGFGISYVEAMYNGCISIGTKNEGIDGFIINGVNGFLINIDEIELERKILEIFDNVNLYEKIRISGIESAKKLSWRNNSLNYIELLNGEENV